MVIVHTPPATSFTAGLVRGNQVSSNPSSSSPSQSQLDKERGEELAFYVNLAFEKGVTAIRDHQSKLEPAVAQLRQYLERLDQHMDRMEGHSMDGGPKNGHEMNGDFWSNGQKKQSEQQIEGDVDEFRRSQLSSNGIFEDPSAKSTLYHQSSLLSTQDLQDNLQQKLDCQATLLEKILDKCNSMPSPMTLRPSASTAALRPSRSRTSVSFPLGLTQGDWSRDISKETPDDSRNDGKDASESQRAAAEVKESEDIANDALARSNSFHSEAERAVRGSQSLGGKPFFFVSEEGFNMDPEEEESKRSTAFDFHLRTLSRHTSRRNKRTCTACLRKFGFRNTLHRRSHDHEMCLERFVHSVYFNALSSCTIIGYSLCAGLEANLGMEAVMANHSVPSWIDATMHGFNGWFAFEVLLRFVAEGGEFFYGRDGRWNMFDLLLVMLSTITLVLGQLSFGVFRLLRVFKILRALKIVRVFRVFAELRLLVATILTSMAALWWSAAFVLIITYLCSILFVQGAITYLEDVDKNGTVVVEDDSDRSVIPELKRFFRTFGHSMYYLIASITGGVDWTDVAWPLWEMNGLYGMAFTIYVLMSILGILNIVTGMFVERASKISKIDRDFAITDEIHRMEADIHESIVLFNNMDIGKKGKVEVDHFMDYLTKERVIAYFATLDIDVTDRKRLRSMFDVDSDGCVTLEEFVIGCVRLRGSAKKSDLVAMTLQMRKLQESILILGKRMHNVNLKVDQHGQDLRSYHQTVQDLPLDALAFQQYDACDPDADNSAARASVLI